MKPPPRGRGTAGRVLSPISLPALLTQASPEPVVTSSGSVIVSKISWDSVVKVDSARISFGQGGFCLHVLCEAVETT